jgi:esterase/lipase superfamily enzyme
MSDHVISVRNTKKGKFGTEPGPTRFLKVPGNEIPNPDHAISKKNWVDDVLKEIGTGTAATSNRDSGDVLVFIHGYNNPPKTVIKRHRLLKKNLASQGYDGALVTFDWPANDVALNYLEDRSDAKKVAIKLVEDCISLFSVLQSGGCEITVHLLAHSTGAFVIREAFDDADDRKSIASKNWSVSQIAFIGGDVSSASMAANDSKSSSIYRHCVRLTNYQNPFDSILKLSNVKRVGVAPRVGRIGLPDDADAKAVNVDCGNHWKTLTKPPDQIGAFDHSWHFGDKKFIKDLVYTLQGDIDRHRIPTRKTLSDGTLSLA